MVTNLIPSISPENRAIQRLVSFAPPDGYYLAFSGGKDSICLKHLADMSGVKYDAHYNITSADPPELVQFIRKFHPDVIFDRPETTMWKLIPSGHGLMPPTRLARYCCEHLKERGGEGRVVLTGVRAQESSARKRTGVTRQCPKNNKVLVNPIIDWTELEVWEHIRHYELPYPELYDQGFSRLGCIGCPMKNSDGQKKDFSRWPKYRAMYIKAFEKMLIERRRRNLKTSWIDAEGVMSWWLADDSVGPENDTLKEN